MKNNHISVHYLNIPSKVVKLDVKKFMLNVSAELNLDHLSLDIFIIKNKQMIPLNRKTFNHNYPTDIITLNFSDNSVIEAQIYISIQQIYKQAAKSKWSRQNELKFVLVHGLLHLMGYVDDTEDNKKKMWAKQLELMEKVP